MPLIHRDKQHFTTRQLPIRCYKVSEQIDRIDLDRIFFTLNFHHHSPSCLPCATDQHYTFRMHADARQAITEKYRTLSQPHTRLRQLFLQPLHSFVMTPAINLVTKKKVPHTLHSYQHDAGNASYGLEAAEKLNLPPQRVFKTLVAQLGNGTLAVAIIPVDQMLSMKQLAKAAGVKKAEMAEKNSVEKTTGYVLGGVSPLGQKKLLATFLDSSAAAFATIFVSAGRRGLEIELAAADLLQLTRGTLASLCQED